MKVVIAITLLGILASSALAEPRSGQSVYNQFCTVCHSIGVANAPKTHDKAAWQARNKDQAALLEGAKKGINAMPPNGTCMDCTDEELKAAIDFMMKEE